MQRFLRTRIAPTPSGYLHLGNVFSFAVTVALARQSGARILLRIDDLDRERVKPEYVEDIFETLAYLDIPWDEGPKDYRDYTNVYSQLHRMERYEAGLRQLRDRGLVFACDCSRTTLLRNHPEGVYTGTCVHRGLSLDAAGYNWRVDTSTQHLAQNMHYFVVRKKDGFPSYQLTSLIDDRYFGVDLIVRGEDLWPSTLAQTNLAQLLGYHDFLGATFRHHVLLKTEDDKKLAKSAGATSIRYLRRQGYTKAAIYRMVGQLAGTPNPIASWEELTPLIPIFILPVQP